MLKQQLGRGLFPNLAEGRHRLKYQGDIRRRPSKNPANFIQFLDGRVLGNHHLDARIDSCLANPCQKVGMNFGEGARMALPFPILVGSTNIAFQFPVHGDEINVLDHFRQGGYRQAMGFENDTETKIPGDPRCGVHRLGLEQRLSTREADKCSRFGSQGPNGFDQPRT